MSAEGGDGTASGAHADHSGLLIEAYLDGTIDHAGAQALAALISAGGTQAAGIRSRLEFSGLLAQALDRATAEDVARAIGERIDAEGDTSSFARRVARALPSRPHFRRRASPLPALAAAALVAVVILAAWWALARTRETATWQVATAAAGAQVVHAGASAPARPGLPLGPGDAIQAAGATTLRGADGSRVVLLPGARLALVADSAGTLLRLELGELEAEIAPQPAQRSLVLTTAQARVEVIGTRFTLAAAPARTRLDLAHGMVRFIRLRDGAALELHADQTATIAEGVAFAAQALHPPANSADTAAAEVPLFAGDLADWWQQHGSWRLEGGLVRGDGEGGSARLLSRRSYGDLILTCRLRIVDADRAEVQVGDYNWFFTVPAGTHGWIQLRLVEQGGALSASADGVALTAEPGSGQAPRSGPLAFYAMRGRIDIADARIRAPAGGPP